MEASFSYFVERDQKFAFLHDPESIIPSLVENLNEVMESHTHGNWKNLL